MGQSSGVPLGVAAIQECPLPDVSLYVHSNI